MPVQFKIESVFNVADKDCFVLAKHLSTGQHFAVTEKSFLGGIEIRKFLDQPRVLDERGRQREDLFAFYLKNHLDASQLSVGSIVDLIPGNNIHCLLPWYFTDLDLSIQLRIEISNEHVLFGKSVKTIAKRQDNDDVLFELDDADFKYAVVHLTWARKTQEGARCPITRLYKNWQEVYEDRIVVDNIDWD
jgi:hypothetical protein